MINLTCDDIILLHDKIIQRTGGFPGLRDIGLLESAVYSAQEGFEDNEIYPTAEEKAARLAFAITQNHAFTDGNKRIGMLAMLMTLRLNGVTIRYTQKELVALGLSVASGTSKYDEILKWIKQHRI